MTEQPTAHVGVRTRAATVTALPSYDPNRPFVWTRTPAFAPLITDATRASILHASTPMMYLSPAQQVDDSLRHKATGDRSAFASVLTRQVSAPALARALTAAVQQCPSIDISPDGAPEELPPRLHRTLTVFDEAPRAHAAQRTRFEQLVKTKTSQRFRAVVRAVVDDGETVPVHGGAGLGALVAPVSAALPWTLLTGEDLGFGPASFDVAYMMGDCVEVLAAATRVGRADVAQTMLSCVDELASSCAASGDDESLAALTALRIVIHAHDAVLHLGMSSGIDGLIDLADTVFESGNVRRWCRELR